MAGVSRCGGQRFTTYLLLPHTVSLWSSSELVGMWVWMCSGLLETPFMNFGCLLTQSPLQIELGLCCWQNNWIPVLTLMFQQDMLHRWGAKIVSNFIDSTIEQTATTDAWEWTARSHLYSITYHINHHEGNQGKGDIWHNRSHFLDPAMHSGCLYVWSLAVWAHIDSANIQQTHSSIQYTADLWSICDSSRTICSFFWPSLSRHTFFRNLSTPNEDKGEHQSQIYQSTLNYLKVPRTDGWIMSTWRPFSLSPRWFLLSSSSRHIPENTQQH